MDNQQETKNKKVISNIPLFYLVGPSETTRDH